GRHRPPHPARPARPREAHQRRTGRGGGIVPFPVLDQGEAAGSGGRHPGLRRHPRPSGARTARHGHHRGDDGAARRGAVAPLRAGGDGHAGGDRGLAGHRGVRLRHQGRGGRHRRVRAVAAGKALPPAGGAPHSHELHPALPQADPLGGTL
ncbi:MAG: Transcriptional regulator, AsnC family, partial [uncultured Acetobacteraceae bacterium]